MKVLYYPGCSLKNTFPEFEKSAYSACQELGIDLLEIPEWECCGVNPSLAEDNVMRHLGAIRSLINAQEKGKEIGTNVVVIICSMCYNVLKRVHLILEEDSDILDNVNAFIDDQPDYVPQLKVKHFLTMLEEIGLKEIEEKVRKPLKGLKVATYYGCLLLRPDEPKGIPIDNPEHPTIFENLVRSLGAEPVEFPFKSECCGNYHIVSDPDIVERRTRKIIASTRAAKADVITSSCPLCTYNLRRGNETLKQSQRVPVVFFTQLLALALGVNPHLSTEVKDRILKKIGGEQVA